MERQRFVKLHDRSTVEKQAHTSDFVNPYSYESNDEARVQLELEHRAIPFSYRWFDGSAPTLKMLIPDYHPEFTLLEYKVVITILGAFYGSLPGVLDRTALAQAALNHDGWKVVIWLDSEIKSIGVAALMHRDLPQLDHPTITGPERPSPYGHPLTMETRRRYLRGRDLLRRIFLLGRGKTEEDSIGGSDSGRIRTKHLHPERNDTGRYRPVSRRYRGDIQPQLPND